jgi:uncharacterized membrane protein
MGFSKLLYAILLTIAPVTELRVGLPLAISYGLENNIPLVLIFSTILLFNILVIFIIFFLLDNVHHILLKSRTYEKMFNIYIKRFQKKVDKFERRYDKLGFLALVLFVAVPLPGTGAWTGSLLSWILELDRKKSILAISIGVIIAGLFVFFGTLGFINLFY